MLIKLPLSSVLRILPAMVLVGALLVPLSGCVQKKDVSGQQDLLSQPTLDAAKSEADFSFPSQPPNLTKGKVVFEQNCATCHGAGGNTTLSYAQISKTRPIDSYLMLTRGDNNHPKFNEKLTRDQRWEALFYTRYIAGEGQIQNKDIAAIFGSNCAVCHGNKGFADGPLYTGHASAHELGMAPVKNAFEPPPANFHSYSRMYNRTNEEIARFIREGIYPSAMPSWLGREDKDKGVVFDEALITDLVKFVRTFGYDNVNLPESGTEAPSARPAKELSALMPGQAGVLEAQKR